MRATVDALRSPIIRAMTASPLAAALERVGDRWSLLIIEALLAGPRRFTELRRLIGGVTPKVLTQTLRTMERDGLVTRQVFAEVPPRVEYALTPLGLSLHKPIQAITEWAEENVEAVVAARTAHDA